MDKIVINGPKILKGEIISSGSKNAALPILAATILNPGISELHNVPHLQDIKNMIQILEFLGAKCVWKDQHTLIVDASTVNNYIASYEQVRKMRASICVLGPLVGRFGHATVSLPGGCIIGPRPIDLHVKGLRELGVKIDVEHGYVKASVDKLVGGNVFIGGRFGSSVLATANIICAAVYAEGVTVIEPAAMEPEVVDLMHFLKSMGADIQGEGSSTIVVRGGKPLHDTTYRIITDRIETGTFMIGAAMTGGHIMIHGGRADHLRCLIDVLKQTGVKIITHDDGIEVFSNGQLKAIDIVTHPYPGFPTDLQAQIMALLTIAQGISVITEKVYTERFMHVSELNRLGAQIALEGSIAIIKGNQKLSGAQVMASDLRASAALLLAGLVAEGRTEVLRMYHLDRGYERIDEKLALLGADIERVTDKPADSDSYLSELGEMRV